MLHFTTIKEMTDHFRMDPPKIPLFFPNRPSKELIAMAHKYVNREPFTSDFFVIALKKIKKGSVAYGRTKYDFEKGTLMFFAPNQVSIMEEAEFEHGGFSISFHKDFLLGHNLARVINKYHFFEYSMNEALHLSDSEELTLQRIYDNIEAEYFRNSDEFSKNIILSHLETLLKYAHRFYKRQFLNRNSLHKGLLQLFFEYLKTYIQNNNLRETGLPTVELIANELSVSKRYLSDCIKAETGKTAKEQINLFLIDEAKNLLLTPNVSVSETAYQLGFKYPEYFSRLFKNKTGVSPKLFIKQHIMNS
ncbi:helix-turn-helix domain-containing protein [Tenacibaculum agarivorans]|uniref:helix-turn-helix domain-containing protein n=1 Tax=Tenacibaculum agarivorans TaxID=1908389 RepID=UPI00094BB70F|nr:response regulator transcription factor [Tenacibaculum agarivorans]